MKRYFALLTAAALCAGCGISGTIVDRSKLEIPLRKISLADHPRLKILYNGVIREMPLKAIKSVRLYPAHSLTFERELYYGAEVTLSDGTTLAAPREREGAYICIRNTIRGKNRQETVTVGLEKVQQINVR